MHADLDLSFRGLWPRFFLRLGGLSLLADGQDGVLEVNGRPVRWLARTSGPTNPLDALGERTQLELPEDRRLAAMGQALLRFAKGRPVSPVDPCLKLLGVLAGFWALLSAGFGLKAGAWWTWGTPWEPLTWAYFGLYIGAGLLLQVLAAQVRGISALAYAGLWLGCLTFLGHPGYGALALPVVFLLALSRFLNPWLGPLAALLFLGGSEGQLELLHLSPWLGMAALLTLMEALRGSRPLQIPAEPGFQDLARGAEALAQTRVWAQAGEDRPLTDVLVWKAEAVALPRGAPLWVLENGAETLTLLPGALLWAREGIRARILPWNDVHLLAQPCAWRNAPKTVALGPEQWLLTLWIPGARPWTLLVADATWGRRCSQAWGRFMYEPTDEAPEPPPPPGRRREDLDLFEAYRALGLHPGIPPEQVRRAFHELARQHHPDAHPDATPEERARLEARMQALNEAYAKLREEGAA